MGRTRKTLVALSAGLVGVLIMAGVAAASRGSEHAPGVAHSVRHDDVTSSSVVSTTLATGVSTTLDPEHANPEPGDDNGVDAGGATGGGAVDDHGHDAVADDTSTTIAGDTTTSMPDEASTSMPDETSTTLAPIDNGMRTFVVAGGTVTVDIENGVLTLVSVTPNPGVEVKDQKTESDRVEVEFRGPDGDSRVRVRIDNGRLRLETGDN
jgi:hypothetical protein